MALVAAVVIPVIFSETPSLALEHWPMRSILFWRACPLLWITITDSESENIL